MRECVLRWIGASTWIVPCLVLIVSMIGSRPPPRPRYG